jgi:hypothetical protein
MNHEVVVTVAKVGTTTGGLTTVIAGALSQVPIAVYGLIATIAFGVLGLAVTYYFKNKEYRIKLAEFKAKHKGADPDYFLDTLQSEI